jgi:hypothetical protein
MTRSDTIHIICHPAAENFFWRGKNKQFTKKISALPGHEMFVHGTFIA